MKNNLKSSKFKGIFVSNLILLFSFFFFSAQANNYYFSANGNDGNAGTSPSSAWKSLNKFNSTTLARGTIFILIGAMYLRQPDYQ